MCWLHSPSSLLTRLVWPAKSIERELYPTHQRELLGETCQHGVLVASVRRSAGGLRRGRLREGLTAPSAA